MSDQKQLAIAAIQSLFNQPRQIRPVENTDLAQYILTHANSGPSKTISADLALKEANGASTEKPSFLSHIFDAMSAGLYGVSKTTSDLIQTVHDAPKNNPNGNPLESILQGMGAGAESIGKNLTGALARSSSDVFQAIGQTTGIDQAPIINKPAQAIEHGLESYANKVSPRHMSSQTLAELGVKNKAAKYGGGFVADVLSDPLTYVPGLDVISTLKKAREAKLAAQGLNPEHIATNAGEALDNAAAHVPSIDVGATKPGISSVLQRPNIPNVPSGAEMATGRSMIPPVATSIPNAALPPAISTKPSFLQHFFGNTLDNPQNVTDMQAAQRVDNAKRAANVRWGKPIDAHEVPVMSREEKAALADRQMAEKGIVKDGKGVISNTAVSNVTEDIRQGIIPRFGPDIAPAEGAAASKAQEIAQKLAQNLSKPARKGRSVNELTPVDQINLHNSLYSEAARMTNEQYAAKQAARVLKPHQQNVADAIKIWAEGETKAGKTIAKADVQKQVDALVTAKAINKTDAKAVVREFFPPEPIRNFAATRYGKRQVEQTALSMLKTAEDHLISQGVQPTYWNGMRVRLSDVLAESGIPSLKHGQQIMDAFVTKDPFKVADPVVREAVSKALARRSMAMSDLLSEAANKAADIKNTMFDAKPYRQAKQIVGNLPQQAKEAMLAHGATEIEANAARDHIKDVIQSDYTPADMAMEHVASKMNEATLNNHVDVTSLAHVNQGINRTLEMTPKELATNVTGSKMIDGLFTKFSTIYGRQHELKRFTQDAFLHGELNAIYRAKFFRGLGLQYTPDQLTRGFKYAQLPGKMLAATSESDPKVLGALEVFQKYFDEMLADADSVATRSQMNMDLVNKHLQAIHSPFKFTNAKKVKVMGINRDFSAKGEGWIKSWQAVDPTETGRDPISLMHDIDLAFQRAVAENSFFDEAARNFGARTTDAHFNPAIHKWSVPKQPRLDGYFFHPEIRNQLMRMQHDLEQGTWAPKGAGTRFLTQATRIWKSSVTIYFPAHHERNLLGDAFNTWWAGYNDPRIYSRAMKVLRSQKPRYAEALRPDLTKMTQSEAIANFQKVNNKAARIFDPNPETRSSDVIFTNKKTGMQFDAHQLWTTGFDRGIFLTYNKSEDLWGHTPMGQLFGTSPEQSVKQHILAPFGGRAHHVAATLSEHREHYARMAHYIGAVDKLTTKYGTKDMNKIFDEAAHEVRKWHPDGSDLTIFEQKIRAVAIPFYSWTRKEIPLLLQALGTRPAKVIAPVRIERAVAGMSGIPINDNAGMLDPYPNDQLFPDWLRASGIGPIGDPNSDNPVARFWAKFAATTTSPMGTPQGYSFINPSNPFNDTGIQLFGSGQTPQNSLQALLNSANPAIQIPGQLAFNQTFSGAPITKDKGGLGFGAYMASQIPQFGTLGRMTGIGKSENAQTNDLHRQNIINLLTSLGIRGSGPYIKSAEFEAKARAKNANNTKQ